MSREPGLAFVGGAAFLGGAIEIYALIRLHDLFTSFMSGNTVILGRGIGTLTGDRAGIVATLLGMFVAGGFCGTILAELARPRAAAVTGAVTILLAAAAIWPDAAVPLWAFAGGALNATCSTVDGIAISITYVTGTLFKVGQSVGRGLVGRGDGAWRVHGTLWLCFLGGAIAAAAASRILGSTATWPLAAVAALLTAERLLAEVLGRHPTS